MNCFRSPLSENNVCILFHSEQTGQSYMLCGHGQNANYIGFSSGVGVNHFPMPKFYGLCLHKLNLQQKNLWPDPLRFRWSQQVRPLRTSPAWPGVGLQFDSSFPKCLCLSAVVRFWRLELIVAKRLRWLRNKGSVAEHP